MNVAVEHTAVQPRRVVIYHPWVYLKSGLERTLLELKRRSRHDWTILTSHFDAEGTYPELGALGVTELNHVSVQRRYGAVLRGALAIVRTKLDPKSYDLLVISCDGLGSLLTFRNTARPVACICFTPLRAVYDEAYRARHLNRNRAILPVAIAIEAVYRWIDRRAWQHYDRVFCISRTVRDRVIQGQLCDENRIEVAYPGIDTDRIAVSTTFEPFFFLPGRIMWTKNIELGIEAFRRLDPSVSAGFRLVIAGMVDEKSRPYLHRLRELVGDDLRIEFIVGPDDATMRDLYERCYALLFTAFNEDLGLTPLEAMTVGKPSIAVNRGGPREVIIDGKTGRLVDADPDAFAAAMTDFIRDPALVRRMGLTGARHCQKFSWDEYVSHIDRYVDNIPIRN